ncbi:putative leader peptide [Streptomyces sp. NPDC005438]|uniref:putative leader peptide n=1 Tax=Streptomyces sp. NPDC005438 TaxID=3156880 RepID=UPI00339DDCD3
MVVHDVNAQRSGPGAKPGAATGRGTSTTPHDTLHPSTGLLGAFGGGVERRHVDLCRSSSAICSTASRRV